MSGYSPKSLTEKLGYKADDSVFCIAAPEWFLAELKVKNIQLSTFPKAVWGHVFFKSHDNLTNFLHENDLNDFKKGLWVSWPKKSSGVKTDLTEQTFRDAILPMGWVDIKVAAIDETWSALKFVRRKSQ